MKKILLSLSILLAAANILAAQESSKTQSKEIEEVKEVPFVIVEQMPTFEGKDLKHFGDWVTCRLLMPEWFSGKASVLAQFVIKTDGSLTDIKILRSPDQRLSDEVVRVLKSSPLWDPGKQRGKAVSVQFALPVKFSREEIAPAIALSETQAPEFKQGGFLSWVEQWLKYPEDAAPYSKNVSVVTKFTITAEGKLTNIEILESPGKAFSDEVKRVMYLSPKWTPGRENGKPVDTRLFLPVRFTEQSLLEKGSPVSPDEPMFVLVERQAMFDGGYVEHFRDWVVDRIKMPKRRRGRFVDVQFTITAQGQLTDIEVLEGSNPAMARKVVEVMSSSPKWKPATQRRKPCDWPTRMKIEF